MENLIIVLEQENREYLGLIELSTAKTATIVAGNIEELTKITDEEQSVVSKIMKLEKQREETIKDIANVLNKDVTTLTLTNIIKMLGNRPEEQEKLDLVHKTLKDTLSNMVRVNQQNKLLIESSLELVEFDLNILKAINSVPETANYNKGAYNVGNTMGENAVNFDTKQ